MRNPGVLLTLLFFFSCTINDKPKDPIVPSIKASDRIDIVFYNNGDSLNFQTQDPKGIEILVAQISGKKNENKTTCSAIGELRYLVKDQVVYTSAFSIDTANKNNGCNFVQYQWQNQQYKHELTERAENMLQKIYSSANKQQ